MIAAVFIFSITLPALWAVSSLSSSSRNDLFAICMATRRWLFVISVRGGSRLRRALPRCDAESKSAESERHETSAACTTTTLSYTGSSVPTSNRRRITSALGEKLSTACSGRRLRLLGLRPRRSTRSCQWVLFRVLAGQSAAFRRCVGGRGGAGFAHARDCKPQRAHRRLRRAVSSPPLDDTGHTQPRR